jgi:hypothetical protein
VELFVEAMDLKEKYSAFFAGTEIYAAPVVGIFDTCVQETGQRGGQKVFLGAQAKTNRKKIPVGKNGSDGPAYLSLTRGENCRVSGS